LIRFGPADRLGDGADATATATAFVWVPREYLHMDTDMDATYEMSQ